MSDVAADALVDKGEILVEYAKPYGLNRTPNGNLASLGIIISSYIYIIYKITNVRLSVRNGSGHR